MIRTHLETLLSDAVAKLVATGRLPAADFAPVEIADPRAPEHGDYATNFALVNAKAFGTNPRALAEALAGELSDHEDIEAAEVAGPGFLNLRLASTAITRCVGAVLAAGVRLSHSVAAKPLKINVEFVSVNPNGPITVGSGRGAAFGSTLCNVLEAAGHDVHREYYINDGVNSTQMQLFAESVRIYCQNYSIADRTFVGDRTDHQHSLDLNNEFLQHLGRGHGGQDTQFFRARLTKFLGEIRDTLEEPWRRELAQRLTNQLGGLAGDAYLRSTKSRYETAWLTNEFIHPDEIPRQGYKGDYVFDVACSLLDDFDYDVVWERTFETNGLAWFQEQSQRKMLERQHADLTAFGVEFDTWFSEQSLHDAGAVEACLNQLKAHGVADEETVQYVWLAEGAKGRPVEEDASDEEDESAATETVPAEAEVEAVACPPRSTKAEYRLYAIPQTPDPIPDTPDPKPQTPSPTLWLRSTKFGDDMDRVLRRKDGRLTYIASDVAYHQDKFSRPPDADKLITVLGPDHHGYIGRLTAVVAALLRDGGDTAEANQAAMAEARKRLEVVIFQIVRFVKEGKPAPMRKRDGNIYALIDLIDELGKTMAPSADQEEQRRIGRDIARFFYLMRSHDTHMDFDIDLATKQSDENPVFYAQYAHARIRSVMRRAGDMGYGVSCLEDRGSAEHGVPVTEDPRPETPNPVPDTPDPTPQTPNPIPDTRYPLLTHPKELALIKKIADLPYEVRRCAEDYGVHRLTTYAVELARSYHSFYDNCRVIQPEQPDLTMARLALCEATRLALKSLFDLLGISAPERMDRE